MQPIDNNGDEKNDAAHLVTTTTRRFPTCRSCGSQNVVCDAWAGWGMERQEWELADTFDDSFCKDCEASQKLDWCEVEESHADRTRRLNDEMRWSIRPSRTEAYGSVVVTAGVAERGRDFISRAAHAVSIFNAFSPDNDPYNEHDFGASEIDGEKLFWKIDYYDLAMEGHSPDKSDISVTHRVLTLMFASEY